MDELKTEGRVEEQRALRAEAVQACVAEIRKNGPLVPNVLLLHLATRFQHGVPCA